MIVYHSYSLCIMKQKHAKQTVQHARIKAKITKFLCLVLYNAVQEKPHAAKDPYKTSCRIPRAPSAILIPLLSVMPHSARRARRLARILRRGHSLPAAFVFRLSALSSHSAPDKDNYNGHKPSKPNLFHFISVTEI